MSPRRADFQVPRVSTSAVGALNPAGRARRGAVRRSRAARPGRLLRPGSRRSAAARRERAPVGDHKMTGWEDAADDIDDTNDTGDERFRQRADPGGGTRTLASAFGAGPAGGAAGGFSAPAGGRTGGGDL